MPFDTTPLDFHNRYNGRPVDSRSASPEAHAKQTNRMNKQTADHVSKRRATFLLTRVLHQPHVDAAECRAMREAFENRLPYLSPKHKIPKGTSVDSLLGSKVESWDGVRYGKVIVSKNDSATFEKLQHELAGIDGGRATRQHYQAMHSNADINIHFSKHGASATLMMYDGRKLIFMNTRMSVLDPVNGTTVPISIVLGHEIEHANLPLPLSLSLMSESDKDFTNLEEVRVIDGYEAAMLHALGRSQRSTHISHVLTVDAEGKAGIPYSVNGKETYLRPGQKLTGRMVEANEKFVTLETPQGQRVEIETPMLMLVSAGLEHVQHLGFQSQLSKLEKFQDQRRINKAVSKELSSSALSEEAADAMPLLMEKAYMAQSEMVDQLQNWQSAVASRDTLTITLNPKNLIHLQRQSNDPDPIGSMLAKRQKIRKTNFHNRAVALAALGGGVTLAGVTTYAITEHHNAKAQRRAAHLGALASGQS